MKNLIYIICLFFTVSTMVEAQEESFIQKNIQRAKEQLGGKLLATADEVIEKYVEAIGGRDAVLSIKTMAEIVRNVRVGEEDATLYRYYAQPNYFKAMNSPDDKNYIVSNGQKTCSVSPSGRNEFSTWIAKSISHNRIDGNFIDYKERGIEYEYIGLEGFNTEPNVYYHLHRTFADGFEEELYFEVNSGLLHAIWQTSSPRKNSPNIFYDYREVNGVLFPHIWMRVHDETAPPHLYIVDEIKINEDFSENFFE